MARQLRRGESAWMASDGEAQDSCRARQFSPGHMTLGECVTCGAHTSEPKALHALQSPLPRYMMACVLEQGRPKLMAYARMHFPELRQAHSTHSLQAMTFETCGNLLRLLLQIRLRLTQNLWITTACVRVCTHPSRESHLTRGSEERGT